MGESVLRDRRNPSFLVKNAWSVTKENLHKVKEVFLFKLLSLLFSFVKKERNCVSWNISLMCVFSFDFCFTSYRKGIRLKFLNQLPRIYFLCGNTNEPWQVGANPRKSSLFFLTLVQFEFISLSPLFLCGWCDIFFCSLFPFNKNVKTWNLHESLGTQSHMKEKENKNKQTSLIKKREREWVNDTEWPWKQVTWRKGQTSGRAPPFSRRCLVCLQQSLKIEGR